MTEKEWEQFIEGFSSMAYEYDQTVEFKGYGWFNRPLTETPGTGTGKGSHIILKITDDNDESYEVKILAEGKLKDGPKIVSVSVNDKIVAHVSTPAAAFAVLYC